jgi:hypothetical protein
MKIQVETPIYQEREGVFTPYMYRVCDFLKQYQEIKSYFEVTTELTTLVCQCRA